MKTPIVSALIASLALTAVAVPVFARDGQRERPTFQSLDTNSDGQISQEELLARRAEARAQRFAMTDTDGDGKITLEEAKTAAAERAQERVERMFERADANNDGVLEQGEGPQRDGSRMFARLDADNSGGISETEFDAAAQKIRGRARN